MTEAKKPFEEVDPYNGNKLCGYIHTSNDEKYGALEITTVNDKPAPQFIYCTPKLHYPFGTNPVGERVYNFPKFVKVKVYEKLDGTNICAYSYADAAGKRYVTFKTRLVPVLKQSKWGDFKAMWDEMLAKYPALRSPEPVLSGSYSFSYELWGLRNPHLIVYQVPLETNLLFAIRQDGTVHIPDGFKDCTPLPVSTECTDKEDLVQLYNNLRSEAQQKNKLLEEGNIDGTEGFVMYVLTDEGSWKQYKLKPEMVESIHWTTDSIPINIILATAWNSIESDDLNIEGVTRLLLEEFSEALIEKSKYKIEKAVRIVQERLALREKVVGLYNQCGLTFEKDGKAPVMRLLSVHFTKKDMKKVFSALKEANLVS